MFVPLRNWLSSQGLDERAVALLSAVIGAVGVLVLSIIVALVIRQIVLRIVHRVIQRTRTTWDDALLHWRVLERLSHLAPAIVVHMTAPLAFADFPTWVAIVQTIAVIVMVVVGMSVINAFMNAVVEIYQRYEISRRIYIQSFIQVAKIGVYFVGTIFILSNLLGKSPLVFFSGLGAFTAVLILVFKDAILGLVAGIQLMSNNMVRQGDWIEMPKYGVDGDVLEVNLTTVKVQNWDKTIATVPTYALISESFRNWRGMTESGGRRIKRSLCIDMNSIRFCNDEMLQRFKRIRYIRDYVERKLEEIAQYNRGLDIDESFLINGRHLTNIGTFRAYLEAYLRNHPQVHQELTFLVRHLEPTPKGLPIQIYVFSKDQAWANYEAIQADIFDHVLAVVPLFDLRVFQEPSGHDVRLLSERA